MILRDKIIIVGGGSAGWMSAATLIKAFPEKDITVIESPNTPTVGVGESTIGSINDWLSFLELEDKDWMPHVGASYKLSIKFTDFYKKGEEFHYPFGLPYEPYINNDTRNKWYIKKHLQNCKTSDYAECIAPQIALSNTNKMAKSFDTFDYHKDAAYHFDALLFAKYLKNNYCLPRGVKHIEEHINTIETNEHGITSLNNKHTANLYLDCTGFKSMLMKEVDGEFINMNHILPNDSAWSTKLDYTDKEKQLEPYTNCTAIDNGWVWNIPQWQKIGTGYVYSSKYIDDVQALQDFQNYLGKPKDVNYKHTRMRIGRHKQMWKKNVCSIGLAAGFIEPLESTGLLQTHGFLLTLVKNLERGKVSQFDKDTHNLECNDIFDNFVAFVAMHYSLSHRNDTQYWRDVTNKSIAELELVQKVMKVKHIDHYFTIDGGMHYIATGMNYDPISMTDILTRQYEVETDTIDENYVAEFDINKNRWKENALLAPTLYKFLKEYIYE